LDKLGCCRQSCGLGRCSVFFPSVIGVFHKLKVGWATSIWSANQDHRMRGTFFNSATGQIYKYR
jgi:hypothetical protein